ncbi:NADP-dependent oxidoreductase [Streptosporangium lutulentum]|uniref:NADPH-dependent curcumin reductase CurA n=1 Tax=Streptosporangium lutulentum TaxID=1461250 RepID=A0ABT9QAA7_9ACTN|nr:NADP-dependent oxidoreductase [Streptosporangium lutulentum]MDP9843004.1 NADPH-dependent curcumin reductase CurA [Streptosporangium lutulentum]
MAVLVHQVARPNGWPAADQFSYVEVTTPEPGPGEALVENVYLSVDPYMREEMDERALGTPMEGRSIGRVVESRDPALPVGELVFHRQGWRSHAVVASGDVRVLRESQGVPLSAYLSLLGGTGLSAYVGLTRVARLQPGETVFISAAAGGVGSAAGQIARLLGAGRVIGSTGSAAKAEHLLKNLGFDAALDYRTGDLAAQLAAAAPEGVDVCLDNVGGDHLEAAIGAMRDRGRIAWCGAVAQYNTLTPPPAPRNLFDIVGKSLRLEGFLVRDHVHLQSELEDFLLPHIRSGHVVPDETVVVGLPNVVDAFLSMLRGGNTGKMIVKVAP